MGENSALPFTGERFTPECEREMAYEHWHRYVFAGYFSAGKRVLDLACGEGYGAALLARNAKQVIGMDVAAEAVSHASSQYADVTNLSFQVGDCAAIPLDDESVDLVVSFETLEHISPQAEFLRECRRVLAPDGMLIVSTPDKRTYSDLTGYQNEFHVRELYRDEFVDLIQASFPAWRLYGQKLLFQSMIWRVDHPGGGYGVDTVLENGEPHPGAAYDPLYFLACCAASESHLPADDIGLWSFGDQVESVYRHYDDEVRRNIHARGVLAAFEARIAELEEQLAHAQANRNDDD